MKKRIGIRALAVFMSAAMMWSAASGVVYAKPAAAVVSGIAETSDVSDASAGSSAVAVTSAENIFYDGGEVSKVGAAPTGLTGAGTSANPYMISTVANLKAMSDYINYEDSSDKYFSLANDIDLSSLTFTSDIQSFDDVYALVSAKATLSGNSNVYFHFNGNGHKLTGLNITLPASVSAFGLFGFINSNSVIENLVIETANVQASRTYNSAYGLLAAQNNGVIRDVTITDSVLDLRGGSITSTASEEDYLTALSAGHIYKGHSLVTADNNGSITGVTVRGTNADKGIIVKGVRRFVGAVAGQNRKTINDVTVSGVRILSYGSSDSNSTIAGSGAVSQYVGLIAGRNNYRSNRTGSDGSIENSKVTMSYGSDILYGDYVGGAVGSNAGAISGVEVNGTFAPESTAPSGTDANLYGFGRYGAIAGSNSGSITSSGSYNVGFAFAKQDENNCYGGIAGFNSGSVAYSVSTGIAQVNHQSAAGVGGLIGNAQTGTTLVDNYSFVNISQQTSYTGALVGKNGTTVHIGSNNFWSSKVSGILYPVPESGAGQNDLQVTTAVINAPAGSGGISLNSSSIGHSWSQSSASVTYDSTKALSTDNAAIHASKTSTGFTITCATSGTYGNFQYYVSVVLPSGVGISGKTLSVRLSIPVLVTDTAVVGAGTSASNPIILTSYAQFKFIEIAPAASYKMGADFAVGSDWTPIAFTGTFDGDSHTLTTSGQIFTEVSGTRNDAVSASDWKTSASNLASGYIYDLTLSAASAVSGAAFGSLNNATLSNVDYVAQSGGAIQISSSKGAAIAASVNGNVLLQDCQVSVPVQVSASSSDGIGALVGCVTANVFVMDNCGSSSPITLSSNLSAVGGLVGSVTVLSSSGSIQNSYASGSVSSSSGTTAASRVLLGAVASSAGSALSITNCYFSVSETEIAGSAVATRPAPSNTGIQEFSFAQSAYDVDLAGASEKVIAFDMPAGLTALQNPNPAEFEFSFENDCVSLSTPASVSGSTVSFGVTSAASQTEDFSITLTVLHKASGLKARVTLRSGLRVSDGFYEIYTVEDLREIANGFNSANTSDVEMYRTANYKLCADIDLSDETDFPKMASTYSSRFTGSFVGKETSDGSKYTISNLTITGTSTSELQPVALFGYAAGATFRNFALDHITVSNSSNGTGVLVGFADGNGSTPLASDCVFEDIDITNCTVTSTYFGKNNNGVATNPSALSTTNMRKMADVGTLAGALWSSKTGNIYTIRNILVKDCTVQDEQVYSYAIGGLIGDCRTTGIVQIGEAGDEPSVEINNVTAVGYTLVGGVVGKAGSLPNTSSANVSTTITNTMVGGIDIQNVLVKNSYIHAPRFTQNSAGGVVGGILGAEKVNVGATRTNASIVDSTVQNTRVVSDNVVTSDSGVGSDAGAIAGQMSGLISGCTVRDCTVQSVLAGGLVSKPSRKTNNTVANARLRSKLTIENSNVLGNTVITRNNEAASLELGGLLACTRNCEVEINGCGVGEGVVIGSSTVEGDSSAIVGGILAHAVSGSIDSDGTLHNDSFMANIENCTMSGDVQILESVLESCAGGIVGKVEKSPLLISVSNCAVSGNVNNNGYFTGGIIGQIVNTDGPSVSGNLISDCTMAGLINQKSGVVPNEYTTGKLIGRFSDTFEGWLLAPGQFIHGNILSSYPQDCAIFGIITDSDDNYTVHFEDRSPDDAAFTASVALTYRDINKPNGKYLHNSLDTVNIEGSVSNTATISITNQDTSVTSGSPARFAFDDSADADLKKFNGWMSISNGMLEVTAADVTASGYDVQVRAKKSSSATGITASYIDQQHTVPGSGDSIVLAVMVPISCVVGLSRLDGDGTESSPFLIRTKEDLDSIRYRSLSAHYALAADIEFTASDFAAGGEYYNNGSYFVPIGYDLATGNVTAFTGSFTNKYDGMLYYLGGVRISSASSATGLFAQASGASFKDVYLDQFAVSATSAGSNGALVGTASNTVFENVEIYNTTVSGGSYAGALAAYATDVQATGIKMQDITVNSANHVGGLFGHAHRTTDTAVNLVSVDELRNLTVQSSNTTTTGADTATAGGIAGQYSGVIDQATLLGNIRISGTIAGGAVGKLDESGSGLCRIQNVSVNGNGFVTSNRTSDTYAAAGGIIGKLRQDSGSNGSNAIDLNLTITGCTVGSGMQVNAYFYAGGVLGNSDSSKGTILISSTKSFASVSAVSENNASGTASAIAAHVYDLAHFTAENCVASGSLRAAVCIGGVIGLADGTAVLSSSGIVTNSVVSCKMTSVGSGDALTGIAIGSVSTDTLPDNLNSAFVNIYYSSFQLGESISLTGTEDLNTAYASALIDVHARMTYEDGKSLPLSSGGLVLGADSIAMDFSYGSGQDYRSFTAANGVVFLLRNIESRSQEAHLFNYDPDTDTLTLDEEGAGYAVLQYDNGLEVAFDIAASDIHGSGTAEDPFVIERIEQLEILSDFSNKCFALGRNLDFSTQEGQQWLSTTWSSKFASLTFTGSLSGMYYPYDSETEAYDTSAQMIRHSISAFDLDSSADSVGLIAILGSGGRIENIDFIGAHVSGSSTASLAGVGVAAGLNLGTISGVTVSGTASGNAQVSGARHVGAIAGVSIGTITGCDVSSCSVKSVHCAGGIVGGGTGASNCTVLSSEISSGGMDGETVSPGEFAGGILGGNLSNTEVSSLAAYKTAVASVSVSNCSVAGSSVYALSTDTITAVSVGGIVGAAEVGATSYYRGITIENCSVGTQSQSVTVTADASANSTRQYNFASGLLGKLDQYYSGLTISGNTIYAAVTAHGVDHGSATSGNGSSAGGLIGGTKTGQRPKEFSITDNVISGTIASSYYAGGIAGFTAFNSTNNTYRVSAGDFICGNIISAKIQAIADSYDATVKPSTDTCGIFMGRTVASNLMIASSYSLSSAIRQNYYSSYVSCAEFSNLKVCGTVSPTMLYTDGAGIYDVAKDKDGKSSFQVRNHREEEGENGDVVVNLSENYEEIVIGYHFEEEHPSKVYNKPIRFIFADFPDDLTTDADEGVNHADLALYSSASSTTLPTVPVYGDKVLTLQDVRVDSAAASAYSSELSSMTENGVKRAISSFEILSGEVEGTLVADLGYGLLVGLQISPDKDGMLADGSRTAPYQIPSAEMFAYYFFSDWSANAENAYLSKYYRQTKDLDFDDILKAIAANGRTFAPIGAAGTPFNGGYNGGGHVIRNFGCASDAQDVGLFGYVSDEYVSLAEVQSDHRLQNIHIEIREDAEDLGDGVVAVAGVTGKYNVGGLVGRYMSGWPILNCSVAYGSVESSYVLSSAEVNDSASSNRKEVNVGGLVGVMYSATLDGCFTSTEVRVYSQFDNTVSTEGIALYSGGGIVGSFEAGSSDTKTLTFNRCLSSSDIVGPMYVSGFVGASRGYIVLTDCASTATVLSLFCLPTDPGDKTQTSNPSLMVGMRMGATEVWNRRESPYVSATNVYVAGLDATSFNTATTASKYYYPVLFGNANLVSSNVEGYSSVIASSNVYYDANAIGRISLPNGTDNWHVMLMSGDVYDINVSNEVSGFVSSVTNSSTSELTSTTFDGIQGDAWDADYNDLYPVLDLYDTYSDAFATINALPVHTDSRETDDLHIDWNDVLKSGQRQYSGVTYPTSVSRTIQDKISGTVQDLSIASSTYSAYRNGVLYDTVTYNSGYDRSLEGNSLTEGGSDRKTDFLFDTSRSNEYLILRNSYLNYGSTIRDVPRDERTPKITVSATLGGIALHRDIRIPLRGEPNTVYVATERQLRAIMAANGGSSEGSAGTKYYDAYVGALQKNIRVCADIDLNPSISFVPIHGFSGGDSGGSEGRFGFDGSNCVISNLTILQSGSDNVGMFDSLTSGSGTVPRLQNVILRNVQVSGHDHVGALVGSVTSSEATINNCMVITDGDGAYLVSGNNYVGGLVGSMSNGFIGYTKTESGNVQTYNQATGAKVNVTGVNYVGGLAGQLVDVDAANCFATGDVTLNAQTVTDGNCAVGGFVGYASAVNSNARILYAFASGNVTASAQTVRSGSYNSTQFGVGGFIGVSDIAIDNCFSSGDVVTSADTYALAETSPRELTHGIGGLVGYSASGGVSNSYSSSMVKYADSGNLPATLVAVGIGGVVGYSTNTVDHCYSSGSIVSSKLMEDGSPVYIGGAVGYCENAQYVFFDKWTNNIVNLQAVGNLSAQAQASSGGYTTDEFCNGLLIKDSKLSAEYWDYDDGENSNTYPYLKVFCNSDVSDYVRYPAVLSVIAVRPNDRDEVAHEGKGYSMALTMPTFVRMKYFDKENKASGEDYTTLERTYNLHWEAGAIQNGSDASYAGGLIQYGHNTFAPIRTSNIEQNLRLIVSVSSYVSEVADKSGTITGTQTFIGYYEKVTSDTSGALEIVKDNYSGSINANSQIKFSDVEGMTKNTYTPRVGDYVKLSDGFKDYGTRTITKLYQMMLGTEDYPYLISTVYDLEHIGFTTDGTTVSFAQVNEPVDSAQNARFYGQWYSPITPTGQQVEGKVHFKFISNVDMTKDVRIQNGIATVITKTTPFAPITSMANNVYPDGITFSGIELDGDDYAVVNFSSAHPFISELDADSNVVNLLFDGAAITADGSDPAALIGVNKGTVDGLMLMAPSASTVSSGISSQTGNAAGIAANNCGTIRNSISQISVQTAGGAYVGGIAAVNSGVIDSCVSSSSVLAGATTVGAGGAVGSNAATASAQTQGLHSYVISASGNGKTIVANDTAVLTAEQIRLKDVYPVCAGQTPVIGQKAEWSLCYVEAAEGTNGALKVVDGTAGAGEIDIHNVISGDFTAEVGDYVILSDSRGLVRNTITSGSVSGGANAHAGGLVGENGGMVQYCMSRASLSGTFEKAGSFCGANGGTILAAFSTGDTSITGTTAASKGSALVGQNELGTATGVLASAFADKALLGQNTYMLVGDAEVTENLIAGTFLRVGSDAFATGSGYPMLRALTDVSTDLKTITTTNGSTYTWLKYQILQGYAEVTSRTMDTAAAQYVDALSSASAYTVTALPSNCTDDSETGTITTSLTSGVKQKIGAGTNQTDDLSYPISYSFHYAVGGQTPNFHSGSGTTAADAYVIRSGDTYTVQDSFAALAYFGKATDAFFVLESDVPYAGEYLAAPITQFNGSLNGGGFTVSDLKIGDHEVDEKTVKDNTSLFGKVTGTVENLGLTGLQITGTPDTVRKYYGLLAAETNGATLHNVYAVGELNVADSTESAVVGGLVGYAKDTTAIGIVTSGYVRNDNAQTGACAGGVYGMLDGGSLQNAASTAYVYGLSNVGGIVGNGVNGTVSAVRFAGQTADTVKATYPGDGADSTSISHILATGSATVNNAEYDKQTALFEENGYTAVSTNAMAKETITGFATDSNALYYPNPVSVSAMSDKFEAGLKFALARITVSLAGSEGSIRSYDQVAVTTPVHLQADTVSLTESRTRFGDEKHYMLSASTASLTPNGGSAKGYTGVRADLNQAAGASYASAVNPIYRYLELNILRLIRVEYVLQTQGVTFADTRAVGVMVRPDLDGKKISANAMTTIGSDAAHSDSVQFRPIVVSGDGLTVDTMVPDGFKATLSSAQMWMPQSESSDTEVSDSSGSVSGNRILLGEETTHVKFFVTIDQADAVWGLRDLTGGVQ